MALTKDFPDYPPTADIKAQIYETLPDGFPHCNWESVDATEVASKVVSVLSEELLNRNLLSVATLFADNASEGRSSYWKDTLSLTAHMRTFKGNKAIAAALTELCQLREVGPLQFGAAQVVKASDGLSWVDGSFHFTTNSPRTHCRGKFMLIPEGADTLDYQSWKIWSMSTWLSGFDDHPEDESLLRQPSTPLSEEANITTDVLIIGGGNAGILLAGRLKAMNVDYVVVDRNKKVGDNWALRYDCMRFHTYKSFCETPYISYPEKAGPGLTRDELANQLHAFAEEFDLDRRVLHQSRVIATTQEAGSNLWKAKIYDGNSGRERSITCKCLILATGAGFSGINLPDLPGRELFKGPSIHSSEFRNGGLLVDGGAKSVVVVGSANTAFDVMVDCYDAGLQTTMLQRSPTYVIPMPYLGHPAGLGSYDFLPTEDCDAMVSGSPLAVGGPLLTLCHMLQALEEPNRYDEVRRAGLRVEDSLTGDLLVNLINRCGGHFVDMGKGIELITTRKVGIRSGLVPTAYTADGLILSDGSEVKTDAVVWCTGFGNLDVRHSLPSILGEGTEAFASKMEGTWGVDAEGEIRGLWKRQPNVENLWVFAGGTAQHRWFSKVIAQQIKGTLVGILPEAYRKTPDVSNWGYKDLNGGALLSNL
ncbi:flavin-containing monooxygenase [Colletotrichum truncatum]|uniref:Flavin-containing monooxygenase n=1 Tax=Colletotrichum truncatum TaxID=5467 RepID=A0ACC3ZB07_COLTU|nr:flavin-containing monooxygenase [Colletotrichum truncatum]KAF6787659.1 flavin-containing monooxygenase [Colletotrichum truncatum]